MLLHLLLLPVFVMFHVVGVIVLFVAVAVLVKALRRGRTRCRAASDFEVAGRSKNSAFDDYRQATLRRLEAEAEEFRKYLDGLRKAADAAAFEAFLKARRAESGPAT